MLHLGIFTQNFLINTTTYPTNLTNKNIVKEYIVYDNCCTCLYKEMNKLMFKNSLVPKNQTSNEVTLSVRKGLNYFITNKIIFVAVLTWKSEKKKREVGLWS